MTDDTQDLAERQMQFLYALRSRGVTDKLVLSAMEQVDRGPFIKGLFSNRAYEDTPLPIACGQTISQPSIVGLMTQALQVNPRDKVLEIGTGSGYCLLYTSDAADDLTRVAIAGRGTRRTKPQNKPLQHQHQPVNTCRPASQYKPPTHLIPRTLALTFL